MSTGQTLIYIEEHPGRWYAWLESMDGWEDDDGEETGRGDGEMFRACGPFPSQEACASAFHQAHANPGHLDIIKHDPQTTSVFGQPLSAPDAPMDTAPDLKRWW